MRNLLYTSIVTTFLAVLLFINHSSLTSQTRSVNVVTDPGFQACLNIEYFGRPSEPTAILDAASLETFNLVGGTNDPFIVQCNGYNVGGLAGVEYLTNLDELDIFDSATSPGSLTDLSQLSNLTDLDVIKIVNSTVSDLSPLSNLPNLNYISVVGNQVSDLSGLSNLPSLTELVLSNNQISDISTLNNFPALTTLNVNKNHLSDLRPLANHPGITTIEATNQTIDEQFVVTSLANTGVFIVYDIDGTIRAQIDTVSGDFTGNEANYTGSWDNSTNFSGNYTIKVIANLLTSTITGDDFISGINKPLTETDVIANANLVITLSDGTILDNSLATIDLSAVDVNTAGDYDIIITLPDDDTYTGSTLTITVTIEVLTSTITGNDFVVIENDTLTNQDFLDNANLEITLSDGSTLDNSLANFDLSTVDTSVPGVYPVVVTLDPTPEYNGSTITINITVEKLTAQIDANDFEVDLDTTLTIEDIINNSNLVITLNDSTTLDNSVAIIDDSAVDTSKPGKYPIIITIPGTDTYEGTTLTIYVTVTGEEILNKTGNVIYLTPLLIIGTGLVIIKNHIKRK